jgi:hypothetical protein
MRERPESAITEWRPPACARPDSHEAWRARKLSDRDLTIATLVGVIAAIVAPFVGFLIAVLLLVERHVPHGLGVMVLALLSSPLFPIWA